MEEKQNEEEGTLSSTENTEESSENNNSVIKNNRYKKYGNIIAIISLILLLTITLFVSYTEISTLKQNFKEVTGELDSITKQKEQLDTDLEDAEKRYNSALASYAEVKSKLVNYQDQEEKINELTQQLQELQANYNKISEENQKLKTENESLKSKQTSSSGTASLSGGGVFQGRMASTDNVGSMVWITASGSKYHNKPDCGNSNPSTSQQISLSEAQSRGYTACKKCY